ncbi:MAG: AAA family ATPase [Polyangiaceae bacterium]|nr:AAA family ATPase [Polyangiaceae bacterium]
MPRTNLKKPPEPLIGRQNERRSLLDASSREDRLFTLVGPPGVGKTRLAVEVALDLFNLGRFAEVWRCNLGAARDMASICDAVAQSIGASADGSNPDPSSHITRAIESRGDVLLLLDEMESAAASAPSTVGQWLAELPNLSVLVTSREPLHIPGENVVELTPLSIDGGEAVDLFLLCTQRVRRAYTIPEADLPFVQALVRELDGLPLAIELCAPRMAVMGPRALLHRMSSRFDLLRRKPSAPTDRHAALALAIETSWMALLPYEQSTLSQLAVFRGGFTLEAAEAVVDLSLYPDAPPIVDVLQSLRDKSLLTAIETPPGADLRLGMLASIAVYTLEKLDSSIAANVIARHAHHVVRTAEHHEQHLTGKDGPIHRAQILADRHNLTQVIERVLGQGQVTARTAEPALRALLVLATLSPYDGPPEAFAAAVGPVLTATKDSGADPRLSARALYARGTLLLSRGDIRAGSRDLVQALAVARSLNDALLTARATCALGEALARRGEMAAAREHFEKAAQSFTQLADTSGAGAAIALQAELSLRQGDLVTAQALADRALSLHQTKSDAFGSAVDLILLGRIACDRNDPQTAITHFSSACVHAERAESRRTAAAATGYLGLAHHLAGNLDAAKTHFETAIAAFSEMGLIIPQALFSGLLGIWFREDQKPGEAYARLSIAAERLDNAGQGAMRALYLAHLSDLEAEASRPSERSALCTLATSLLNADPDVSVAQVVALFTLGTPPQSSAHAIIAARCRRGAGARPLAAPPPPDDTLQIGPSALWFQPPHGERVLLDRRRQLAKMLDHLAAFRLEKPGAALGWEALIETAWPGERILPDAAAHRVRVAISTLRKMGLRDLLRTTDEGYLLAPDVPAVRV